MSVVPKSTLMRITTRITINVEATISFLLDQLTFFISPSAAIMKSATEGLFTSHKTNTLKATSTATGTIVSIHNPR